MIWQIILGGVKCLMVAVMLPSLVNAYDARAVVKIYAYTKEQNNSEKVKQGSGFFIGKDGRILTAYHVVQNAHKLLLWTVGGVGDIPLFDAPVKVVQINPTYDLAILKVEVEGQVVPFLRLGEKVLKIRTPGPNERKYCCSIFGFPRQLFRPNREIGLYGYDHLAISPRNAFKLTIKKKFSGLKLTVNTFRENEALKIIPFDTNSHQGVSGSPLAMGNIVLGVVSGSLSEGGSRWWAIPVDYLKDESTISIQDPNNIFWPPLTLYDPNIIFPTTAFQEINEAYDDTIQELDKLIKLQKASQNLKHSAQALRIVGMDLNEQAIFLLEHTDIPVQIMGSNIEKWGNRFLDHYDKFRTWNKELNDLQGLEKDFYSDFITLYNKFGSTAKKAMNYSKQAQKSNEVIVKKFRSAVFRHTNMTDSWKKLKKDRVAQNRRAFLLNTKKATDALNEYALEILSTSYHENYIQWVRLVIPMYEQLKYSKSSP